MNFYCANYHNTCLHKYLILTHKPHLTDEKTEVERDFSEVLAFSRVLTLVKLVLAQGHIANNIRAGL